MPIHFAVVDHLLIIQHHFETVWSYVAKMNIQKFELLQNGSLENGYKAKQLCNEGKKFPKISYIADHTSSAWFGMKFHQNKVFSIQRSSFFFSKTCVRPRSTLTACFFWHIFIFLFYFETNLEKHLIVKWNIKKKTNLENNFLRICFIGLFVFETREKTLSFYSRKCETKKLNDYLKFDYA